MKRHSRTRFAVLALAGLVILVAGLFLLSMLSSRNAGAPEAPDERLLTQAGPDDYVRVPPQVSNGPHQSEVTPPDVQRIDIRADNAIWLRFDYDGAVDPLTPASVDVRTYLPDGNSSVETIPVVLHEDSYGIMLEDADGRVFITIEVDGFFDILGWIENVGAEQVRVFDRSEVPPREQNPINSPVTSGVSHPYWTQIEPGAYSANTGVPVPMIGLAEIRVAVRDNSGEPVPVSRVQATWKKRFPSTPLDREAQTFRVQYFDEATSNSPFGQMAVAPGQARRLHQDPILVPQGFEVEITPTLGRSLRSMTGEDADDGLRPKSWVGVVEERVKEVEFRVFDTYVMYLRPIAADGNIAVNAMAIAPEQFIDPETNRERLLFRNQRVGYDEELGFLAIPWTSNTPFIIVADKFHEVAIINPNVRSSKEEPYEVRLDASRIVTGRIELGSVHADEVTVAAQYGLHIPLDISHGQDPLWGTWHVGFAIPVEEDGTYQFGLPQNGYVNLIPKAEEVTFSPRRGFAARDRLIVDFVVHATYVVQVRLDGNMLPPDEPGVRRRRNITGVALPYGVTFENDLEAPYVQSERGTVYPESPVLVFRLPPGSYMFTAYGGDVYGMLDSPVEIDSNQSLDMRLVPLAQTEYRVVGIENMLDAEWMLVSGPRSMQDIGRAWWHGPLPERASRWAVHAMRSRSNFTVGVTEKGTATLPLDSVPWKLVSRTYGVIPTDVSRESRTISVRLRDVGELIGTVDFRESEPSAGAIAVRSVFDDAQSPVASTADFTVDVASDGSFRVRHLLPGRYHVRWVPLADRENRSQRVRSLDVGQAGPVQTVDVVAGGTVSATLSAK